MRAGWTPSCELVQKRLHPALKLMLSRSQTTKRPPHQKKAKQILKIVPRPGFRVCFDLSLLRFNAGRSQLHRRCVAGQRMPLFACCLPDVAACCGLLCAADCRARRGCASQVAGTCAEHRGQAPASALLCCVSYCLVHAPPLFGTS